MKRYLFIILLALPLTGCMEILSVIFGSTVSNLTGVPCEIHIVTSNGNNTFYDAPDGSAVRLAEVMDIPDEFSRASLVTLDAEMNVSGYTLVSGEYWFQVRVTGSRSFDTYVADLSEDQNIDEESSSGENAPDVPIQEDIISGGTFWVRGVLDELSEGCWGSEDDDEGESDELSIAFISLCSAIPEIDKYPIQFRVGAGTNRSVLFIAETEFEYKVLGYADEAGSRWYQVDADDYENPVWVNSKDIKLEGICSDIPPTDSPAIIRNVTGRASVGSGTCSDFAIISPIGSAPEETYPYEWTPVDDASEYALNFYDYQGNLAETRYVQQAYTEIHSGSLGLGSQFSFEVFAMRDGEILCGTGRSSPLTLLAARVNQSEPVPSEPTKEKKDKKKEKKNEGGYTPPGE